MAGLLQQGMQQAQQEQQAPPQAQGRQMDESGMRGDPGAQFKPLVENILGYLYGDGLPKVEQMLAKGDPVQSMGQVIGLVLSTVYNMLRAKGKTVDPPVMVRAGMELSKAVGEMAMEMGVLPKGEDDAIETALMLGLAKFGQTAKNLPPEEKQHYARLVQGLKEGKRAAQGGQQQPQGQPPQGQPQGGPQPPQQRPQQPMMQGGR